MLTVSAIVEESTLNSWLPLPPPKWAMLAIVPRGLPGEGLTLGTVARRDPDALSAIVATAQDMRPRDAAKRVRGHLLIGGCR